MWISICLSLCKRVNIWLWVWVSICLSLCVNFHVCVDVYVFTFVCPNERIYVCVNVYVYPCVWMPIFVNVYVYVLFVNVYEYFVVCEYPFLLPCLWASMCVLEYEGQCVCPWAWVSMCVSLCVNFHVCPCVWVSMCVFYVFFNVWVCVNLLVNLFLSTKISDGGNSIHLQDFELCLQSKPLLNFIYLIRKFLNFHYTGTNNYVVT